MKPCISVVIPTYRRHDLLRNCLAALDYQDLEPAQYEVLVCDDANDEATRRFVTAIAATSRCTIRYLPVTGARGPAAARQPVLRAASATNIAFTDDDCTPQRGWL